MQTRRLGRTGHESTLTIIGGAALWEIDQAGANAALDLAADYGLNHIDVAPQYGVAQERVGPWLEDRRDEFFLGCKTLERTRDGAWRDLENSLDLLRTERLDLYQLHSVGTFDELDPAFDPAGAMETLLEAREQGLVRSLGLTGHGLETPTVFMEALERFDFDTVMFPLNPQLYADTAYRQATDQLLARCSERDVGVMIIKSVAKGPWGDREKRYQCWYEPFDTPEGITRGVRFALSQPGVTAIASVGEVRLWPQVFEAAATFQPMDAQEQAEALAVGETLETIFA